MVTTRASVRFWVGMVSEGWACSMQMQAEGLRNNCVEPVTAVRDGEGVQTGLGAIVAKRLVLVVVEDIRALIEKQIFCRVDFVFTRNLVTRQTLLFSHLIEMYVGIHLWNWKVNKSLSHSMEGRRLQFC